MRATPFEAFMRNVDTVLERKYGVTNLDLPDVDYWSMFDQGLTPVQSANLAIVNACEDMGFDPDDILVD